MKWLLHLSAITLISFCIVQSAGAQKVTQPRPGAPGQWRLLGTTHANLGADHDAIIISGPADNFRALKFKVTDAPLDILHFTVTYDNGQIQKIDTRFSIPQGGESRIIDLVGGSRNLRRVDFWYSTKGIFKGTSDVTLFGRK